MTTAQTTDIAHAVVDYVASAYEILRISVHCPLMQRRIDDAKVTLGGQELGSDAGLSVAWQLLPKDLQRNLIGAAAQCRAAIAQYAIPFCARRVNGTRENAVPGLYLVPRALVDKLVDALRVGERRMWDIFATAAPSDETLQRLIREHVGDAAFTAAAQDIPTVAEQLSAIHVDILALSIAVQSGAVADEQQAATAAGVALQAISGPRDTLAEEIAPLMQLISRDGRVTARSFAPVTAAIARFRQFPDATDAPLARALENLERLLSSVVPAHQTAAIAGANGLTAALQLVTQLCSSAAAAEQRLTAVCGRRARPRSAAAAAAAAASGGA